MDEVEFHVSFAPADEAETREAEAALEAGGAGRIRRLEEHGMTGLEIGWLAIGSVIALANIVIRLSRLWRPGVRIDAGGKKIRVTKDPDLPRGVIVMVTSAGEEMTVNKPDEVSLASVLEAALKGGG
jgi:hypothetical protein